MALSGTVNTSSYEGRYVQLSWSATQSVANNTSTISWTLKGAGSASAAWYKAGGFYVKIAGNVVCDWSTDTRITLYNGTVIKSGSLTVSHASDGTKSFSIEVKAGIYTYARNCSGSGNFTLNTIPRASSISWGSGNSTTAGVTDGAIISISRASSSFTHTIKYAFGNASGTICTKTTATTVKWTIPLSLLNQIPSATSGTGTLTCTTYSGSTAVGTSTLKLTVVAPSSVKPTISSASITIDNSANSVIKGWGLYVVGYSKAKITAAASGSYGSTVSSFTISGGYSTTQSGSSLSYTGSKFTSSGSKTFNVVAKDSRGRSSDSKSAGTITVYAYSNPSISALSVQRSSSDAKKIIVKANWSFSSVNNKNSATATLYYKKSSSSGWTTYGTISKNTNVTLTTDFAEEYSYNFKLIVKDAVGNSAQEESFISTIDVLLDFKAGGKGLGIGKIAESDSMEVALDAKFMGTVYIYDEGGNAMTLAAYIKSVVGG